MTPVQKRRRYKIYSYLNAKREEVIAFLIALGFVLNVWFPRSWSLWVTAPLGLVLAFLAAWGCSTIYQIFTPRLHKI